MTVLAPSLRFEDPASARCTIRNGRLEATFQPLAGGRMLSLRHAEHGDLVVPLHSAAFDSGEWPKAGAFPLFPFHNRLRSAAFRHDGRLVRLRPNMPNGRDVMHGPAHCRPWHVTEQGLALLAMALKYRADEDWPFDFTAEQRFELDGDRLSVALSLTNTGDTFMPGGIGWHPYFVPSVDEQVAIAATFEWDPFGSGGLSEPVAQRRNPTEALAGATRHFSGWTTATARIGQGTISLTGHSGLTCLAVLHGTRHLCLEPTSHVAGALEVSPELGPDTGIHQLAPGESLSGFAVLSVA